MSERPPKASLQPLHRADGSVTYSHNGLSVLAAVNGPVEVQRKDELPEEAAIDVVIRPASGVGGVRERHLEFILQQTLRHVILVAAHPRKLIQITLQVMGNPEDNSASGKLLQAASDIAILPGLLHAAVLALLSTSIPLAMALTASLVAAGPSGRLTLDPSPKQLQDATSIHVIAVSSQGRLLVAESEGEFDMDMWKAVVEKAMYQLRGGGACDNGHAASDMGSTEEHVLQNFIRKTIETSVAAEQRYVGTVG